MTTVTHYALAKAHSQLAQTVAGLASGKTSKADLYYEYGRVSGIRSVLLHDADAIDLCQFNESVSVCDRLLCDGVRALCGRVSQGLEV